MLTLKYLNSDEFKKKVKYKISICVTSYNQEKYIGTALDSLLAQKTEFSYAIIVGDDYSTDGSREILKKYEKQYPDKIQVIYHPENMGLFKNRKEIFKNCDSEYITFCDGDDYWIDDECLQRKVEFLDAHPEYVGYTSGGATLKDNIISDYNDLEERNCCFDFNRENALKNEYPGMINGFFFRNIYKSMSFQEFEKYTGYKVDDSGKLSIVAGIIGPIYRGDKKTTYIYRHHMKSRGRTFENENRCKKLFLSHLEYVDMIQELFCNTVQMQIDDQLAVLIVNSFITAVKTTFSVHRKENWGQFFFLYNYGYFTKKQIRYFISKHIRNKIREKLK